MPLRRQWAVFAWMVFIILLSVLFWKARIIDTATSKLINLRNIDLFIEHYPMAAYGFGELAAFRLPLWNPYQLGGMPFFAIPHTGLFYPGNLPYLFFNTAVATEVSLVAHLALSGVGMWTFGRCVGLRSCAALTGALSTMWSGYTMLYMNLPTPISGVCWLPVMGTVVIASFRRSAAWVFAFPLVIACQILNGGNEQFLYNCYACSLLIVFEAVRLGRSLGPMAAVRLCTMLAAAGVLGMALSAFQLLPSLELVRESVRAFGGLDLAQARRASFETSRIVDEFFRCTGVSFVGPLMLVGLMTCGGGCRSSRSIWAYSIVLCLLGLLLATGGKAFEWYFSTPLGHAFRRPIKLLHLYMFGGAILASLGTNYLILRADDARRTLWRSATWWAVVAAVACVWVMAVSTTPQQWIHHAMFASLAAYGLVRSRRIRHSVIYAVVCVHGLALFFATANPHLRPIQRLGEFDSAASTFETAVRVAGHDRIYVSSTWGMLSSLAGTAKQGTLRRIRAVNDYEPLATRRHASYLLRATGFTPLGGPFYGTTAITARGEFRLLDMMSARAYVFLKSDIANRALLSGSWPESTRFFPVETGSLSVFVRPSALPRAYVTHRAWRVDSGDAALAMISSPTFDPWREVVLEENDAPNGGILEGAGDTATTVRFLVDDPNYLRIRVETRDPGYLVLTDTYYPGWRSFVNGTPTDVRRANYLFRGVTIPAGISEIEFRYEPDSFRYGMIISIGGVVLMLVFGARAWRSRN